MQLLIIIVAIGRIWNVIIIINHSSDNSVNDFIQFIQG